MGYLASVGTQKTYDFLQLAKFGKQRSTLCIDMNPVPPARLTSPAIINTSRSVRGMALLSSAMASLTMAEALIVGAVSFASTKEIPPEIAAIFSGTCTAITCLTTSLGSMAFRFNKVVKGDWVITDLPKKIEEKKTAEVPNAVPQPT